MAMTGELVKTRRLFVSLDVESQETRKSLAGIIDELKRAGLRDASFVHPENIHLSLKFLGSVPESRLAGAVECIEKACAGVSPFELRIHGIGFFPERRPLRHARVLFVKAEAGETGVLEGIAGRLSSELSLRGIGERDDKKPFTPHITIARVRLPPLDSVLPALEKIMQRNENTHIGSEIINSVRLKESTLEPGRSPRYDTVFGCELKSHHIEHN